MNNSQLSLIEAYKKGYRIIKGEVISPSGKIRTPDLDSSGYKRFTISIKDLLNSKKISRGVPVHRLVAYQKYGMDIFNPNFEVRHLDGNIVNNLDDNIILGSHKENMMDKPEAVRQFHSIHAASVLRKFTDYEIEKIRAYHIKCGSYKQTMSIFNITSKGTLYYILNVNYKTKR